MRWMPLLLLFACSPPRSTPRVPVLPGNGADDCESPTTWYRDRDEDGVGDPEQATQACIAPAGFVADGTDCDDRDRGTFPGAIEVCDGLDRDCDGLVDGPTAVDAPNWHRDQDGDGFGELTVAAVACVAPQAGLTLDRSDCNDHDPLTYPGAYDPVCDGLDQDCGGDPVPGAAQIGGRAFPTLELALLQASSDDRVSVCPGDHMVHHSRTQSLELVGAGADATQVVLIAPPGQRHLDVQGAHLRLRGLTLKGGAPTEGHGGSVRATVDELVVQDVVFQDNASAGDGGALWANLPGQRAAPALQRIVARRNHAGGRGGALALEFPRGGTGELGQSTLQDNHADGSGGAISVTGSPETNTLVLVMRDVVGSGNRAGEHGGFIYVKSPKHAIIRATDVSLRDHRAVGDGGHLYISGTQDAKIDLLDSLVSNGEAARGGLMFHDGGFTLDLKLYEALLGDGRADQGGLLWVQTGGSGHFDLFGVDLHNGDAPLGSAIWLTGRATVFDATLDEVHIRDNRSGISVEVDPDFWTPDAALHMDRGALWRNEAGGISLGSGWSVDLRASDLGSSVDDNGPFDLLMQGFRYSWTGSPDVICTLGACETR